MQSYFLLCREPCALRPIEDIKQFLGLQRSHLFFWSILGYADILQGLRHILFGEREAKEDNEQVTQLCFRDLCLYLSNFFLGLSLPTLHFWSVLFLTPLCLLSARFKPPLWFKKKKKEKKERRKKEGSHFPLTSTDLACHEGYFFSPLEEGWMTRDEKIH